MAASGVITIGGTISGEPTGSKSLNAQVTLANAVGASTDVVLASGPNTIAVPAGATCALIQPPAGNVVALTLKGITGDTGILIHKTNPTFLSLDPGQASFVITAASLTTGATEINFV